MNQYLLYVCLFLLLVVSNSAYSQSTLRGNVLDASDHAKLENAVVALLHAQDSILVKFARAKDNGAFQINGLDTGRYQLIVSYPQYADYVSDLYVQDKSMQLGDIKLSKAALLLEEVDIVRRIPVVIKGDTIEYDAASFKVEKDAKVEDLLKVLPGITMDANGKITAQGKEVKKVLLDGEEFFGDDPTLITKNIRSDMVSKVQVYERKSDLADRTGIDDGERTQTIDIKLREDKKKGMFGQVLGGGGTDQYYAGKAMVNKFDGARRIAAYGVGANNGLVGLGFEDNQKYGMADNANVSADGGIHIQSGGSDGTDSWSGQYNGNGIPSAWNMGVSFLDKTKDDKHKINVSYKRNQMDVENNTTYFAQNNLPEQARIDNSTGFSRNKNISNAASIRYDLKIDSLAEMIIRAGYNKNDRDDYTRGTSNQRTLEQARIYETENRNSNRSQSEQLRADVLLTRRFRKERRSLTLTTNINADQSNGKSNFYSNTQFFDDNSEEEIDQLKKDVSDRLAFTANVNYNEPLTKRLTASVGYSFGHHTSGALNKSFDQDPLTGEYTVLDERVLNDVSYRTLNSGVNTGLNYKTEQLTINISNQLEFSGLHRDFHNLEETLARDQVTFRPSLSMNYKVSKSKNISARYFGRSLQPSLAQIAPLRQNTQQLITYVENPDLTAGFSNSYVIDYNGYRPLQGKSFYMYLQAYQNIGAITNKVRIDQDKGKQEIASVNMDRDNWSFRMGSSYQMPLFKKLQINVDFGLGGNYTNNYNYLALQQGESQLNNTERYGIGPSIGLSRYTAKKLDFYISIRPGFENLNSSLQPDLNSSTFTFSTGGELMYHLPKDFKISVDMQQSYQSGTQTLQSVRVLNLNSFVSKKLLKDKSLEMQFVLNDILNRNNGINRYNVGYSFVQTSNDVLRRYGMFKLIYNFTTMKGN